jgi:hypothetical protein
MYLAKQKKKGKETWTPKEWTRSQRKRTKGGKKDFMEARFFNSQYCREDDAHQ